MTLAEASRLSTAPTAAAAVDRALQHGGRDERLDLLRGFCIIKMVLTHLWPQPLDTVWMFGFASAAEGFFLISGATTGIVFRRRAESSGFAFAARGLARRGVQLYLLNLGLLFVFLAAETTRVLQYREVLPEGSSPLELFTLNHPYFLQVLPRYAIFLLLAPLVLAGLRAGRTALLVGLSVGLWGLVMVRGGNLPLPYVETGAHGGFFVLSWQLLFYVGMALGYHRERVGRLWRRLPVGLTFVLPAVLMLCFTVLGWANTSGRLAGWGWEAKQVALVFGRRQLGPGRLLDLSCVALVLFAVVDRFFVPLRRAAGWLLLPFGRHALYIFLVHTASFGFFLALGPWLPFALYGHPWRLGLAGVLHFALLWVLARKTPLKHQLGL
ncbi:MAG: OpgC domain-containing protein [Thermoanaerobaculia bacterium]